MEGRIKLGPTGGLQHQSDGITLEASKLPSSYYIVFFPAEATAGRNILSLGSYLKDLASTQNLHMHFTGLPSSSKEVPQRLRAHYPCRQMLKHG